MQIRYFQEGDFVEIESLWLATGVGATYRGDDLSCVMRTLERGGRLLVAEAQSKIVATCWLSYDGRRLLLHHMAVHPDHQRKGLGRKLLGLSIEYAMQLNAQLKLEVDESNQGAIALYSESGLKMLNQFRLMIHRGSQKSDRG